MIKGLQDFLDKKIKQLSGTDYNRFTLIFLSHTV